MKKEFKTIIDGREVVFEHSTVTGKEILIKAGKTPPECFSLYEKLKGCDFTKISLDEKVDLSRDGIEQFVTKEPEVFDYFVDDEPETTDKKELTPNQILELAGLKPPRDYYLVQLNPDGTQTSYESTPNKPIKMKCPSMKFVSVYRGEVPVS
jgi:hypothetical protein